MSDDENKKDAPSPEAAARGEDEAPRWAADEPTAMWNADSVLEHGYDGVAEKLRDEDDLSSPAATDADVRGQDQAKVLTGAALAADAAAIAAAAQRRPKSSSVSWIFTVLVALGIGVAVFFAVRMLR